MDTGVCRSIVLGLLIALGAGVRAAHAQSDAIVQGQVVAAADGAALPGVIVTLEAAAGGVVPAHVTADASLAVDVLRDAGSRPRVTLRVDVANIANQPYVIARDGEFSPAQYSTPRVFSLTARVRF